MNLSDLIILARKHLGGSYETSARACLERALRHDECGFYSDAQKAALRSIAYSVGILHADYAKAFRSIYGKNQPITLV